MHAENLAQSRATIMNRVLSRILSLGGSGGVSLKKKKDIVSFEIDFDAI